MSRWSVRSLLAFSCAIVAVVALACSDPTAPLVKRIPGTYVLSTVLDSLTYSDFCGHTWNGTVCHDTTVAAGAAKFYGTISLGDTTQGTTSIMRFAITDAAFQQADCGPATVSCTGSVQQYHPSTATISKDSLRFQSSIYGSVLVILDGTLAGDEISGRLTWHTYLGCCARRYYTGSFVAKRQP
jgi:hypothetical protein